jgi:hypothetical protein
MKSMESMEAMNNTAEQNTLEKRRRKMRSLDLPMGNGNWEHLPSCNLQLAAWRSNVHARLNVRAVTE